MNRITANTVHRYYKKYLKDEEAKRKHRAIQRVIDASPQNSGMIIALTKSTLINHLYSANVFDIYKMSEHIADHGRRIDRLIAADNLDAVDCIAAGHGIKSKKTNKERIFTSFASKYTSFHNSNAFPIFDNRVEEFLWMYQNNVEEIGSKFNRKQLQNYKFFKAKLDDLIEQCGLHAFNYFQLDKAIWYYHKLKIAPNKKNVR